MLRRVPISLRALTGAALLLAVVLAACSDDSGDDASEGDGSGDDAAASDAERPYVDAFVNDITEDEEFPASDAEAECFGVRIVRLVGAAELEERGITPAEYADAESLDDLDVEVPDDAADRISAALTDCFDDLTGFFREGVIAEAGDAAECVAEGLDEEQLADAFAGSFVGNGDAEEAVVRATLGSLSPACAEQLLVGAGVESGDITEEAAACIADELDDEVALRTILAGAGGDEPDPEDVDAIRTATLACM
jgi:hypothetical protein